MIKSDADKIKALIHKIGLKHNLQDEVIKKVITSPYFFIKNTIVDIDFENKDFNELKTNFILPYIGKMYVKENVVLKYKTAKNKV